ncbi:MAG: hypothetical protein ABH885_03520, partial [Candidatus Omnitrophota bacterium]
GNAGLSSQATTDTSFGTVRVLERYAESRYGAKITEELSGEVVPEIAVDFMVSQDQAQLLVKDEGLESARARSARAVGDAESLIAAIDAAFAAYEAKEKKIEEAYRPYKEKIEQLNANLRASVEAWKENMAQRQRAIEEGRRQRRDAVTEARDLISGINEYRMLMASLRPTIDSMQRFLREALEEDTQAKKWLEANIPRIMVMYTNLLALQKEVDEVMAVITEELNRLLEAKKEAGVMLGSINSRAARDAREIESVLRDVGRIDIAPLLRSVSDRKKASETLIKDAETKAAKMSKEKIEGKISAADRERIRKLVTAYTGGRDVEELTEYWVGIAAADIPGFSYRDVVLKLETWAYIINDTEFLEYIRQSFNPKDAFHLSELGFWEAMIQEKNRPWVNSEIACRVNLRPDVEKLLDARFDPANVNHVNVLSFWSGVVSFGHMSESRVKGILGNMADYRILLEILFDRPLDLTSPFNEDSVALVAWSVKFAEWQRRGINPGKYVQAMTMLRKWCEESLSARLQKAVTLDLRAPFSDEVFLLEMYAGIVDESGVIPPAGYTAPFMENFLKTQKDLTPRVLLLLGDQRLGSENKDFVISYMSIASILQDRLAAHMEVQMSVVLDKMIEIKALVEKEAQEGHGYIAKSLFGGRMDMSKKEHIDLLMSFALLAIEGDVNVGKLMTYMSTMEESLEKFTGTQLDCSKEEDRNLAWYWAVTAIQLDEKGIDGLSRVLDALDFISENRATLESLYGETFSSVYLKSFRLDAGTSLGLEAAMILNGNIDKASLKARYERAAVLHAKLINLFDNTAESGMMSISPVRNAAYRTYLFNLTDRDGKNGFDAAALLDRMVDLKNKGFEKNLLSGRVITVDDMDSGDLRLLEFFAGLTAFGDKKLSGRDIDDMVVLMGRLMEEGSWDWVEARFAPDVMDEGGRDLLMHFAIMSLERGDEFTSGYMGYLAEMKGNIGALLGVEFTAEGLKDAGSAEFALLEDKALSYYSKAGRYTKEQMDLAGSVKQELEKLYGLSGEELSVRNTAHEDLIFKWVDVNGVNGFVSLEYLEAMNRIAPLMVQGIYGGEKFSIENDLFGTRIELLDLFTWLMTKGIGDFANENFMENFINNTGALINDQNFKAIFNKREEIDLANEAMRNLVFDFALRAHVLGYEGPHGVKIILAKMIEVRDTVRPGITDHEMNLADIGSEYFAKDLAYVYGETILAVFGSEEETWSAQEQIARLARAVNLMNKVENILKLAGTVDEGYRFNMANPENRRLAFYFAVADEVEGVNAERYVDALTQVIPLVREKLLKGEPLDLLDVYNPDWMLLKMFADMIISDNKTIDDVEKLINKMNILMQLMGENIVALSISAASAKKREDMRRYSSIFRGEEADLAAGLPGNVQGMIDSMLMDTAANYLSQADLNLLVGLIQAAQGAQEEVLNIMLTMVQDADFTKVFNNGSEDYGLNNQDVFEYIYSQANDVYNWTAGATWQEKVQKFLSEDIPEMQAILADTNARRLRALQPAVKDQSGAYMMPPSLKYNQANYDAAAMNQAKANMFTLVTSDIGAGLTYANAQAYIDRAEIIMTLLDDANFRALNNGGENWDGGDYTSAVFWDFIYSIASAIEADNSLQAHIDNIIPNQLYILQNARDYLGAIYDIDPDDILASFHYTKTDAQDVANRNTVIQAEQMILIAGVRTTGSYTFPQDNFGGTYTIDGDLVFTTAQEIVSVLERQAEMIGEWSTFGAIFGIAQYDGTNETHRALVSLLESQIKVTGKREDGTFLVPRDDLATVMTVTGNYIFTTAAQMIASLQRQNQIRQNWQYIKTIFGMGDYMPTSELHRAILSSLESMIKIASVRETGVIVTPDDDLQGISKDPGALTFTTLQELLDSLARQETIVNSWNDIRGVFGITANYTPKNPVHRALVSVVEAQVKITGVRETGTIVTPKDDLSGVDKTVGPLIYANVNQVIAALDRQQEIIDAWPDYRAIYGITENYNGGDPLHRAIVASIESMVKIAGVRETGVFIVPKDDLSGVDKVTGALVFDNVADVLNSLRRQVSVVDDWANVRDVFGITGNYNGANILHRALVGSAESLVKVAGARETGTIVVPEDDLSDINKLISQLVFVDIQQVIDSLDRTGDIAEQWDKYKGIFGITGSYVPANVLHRAIVASLESLIEVNGVREQGSIAIPNDTLDDVTKQMTDLIWTTAAQLISSLERTQAVVTNWNDVRGFFGFGAYDATNPVHRAVAAAIESSVIVSGVRQTGKFVVPLKDLSGTQTVDANLIWQDIGQAIE